jgi:hypothetical protein
MLTNQSTNQPTPRSTILPQKLKGSQVVKKSPAFYLIFDLLTATGLSPCGSTHLHTNNTQDNTNNRITQIQTNVEECGPCPVFASFTLAFALQLRRKYGKTSVGLRKTSVKVQYTYYQKNTHTLQNPHKHTHGTRKFITAFTTARHLSLS